MFHDFGGSAAINKIICKIIIMTDTNKNKKINCIIRNTQEEEP